MSFSGESWYRPATIRIPPPIRAALSMTHIELSASSMAPRAAV